MFDEREFAGALKRFRLERGLKQSEVAQRLNVSVQSVSRWECGLSVPDIVHLTELAPLLGVSLDALIMNKAPETGTLIGVDAGGTKSEFVLIDEGGTLLNRVILEGCNPNVSGIEETIRIAKRGISLLRPVEMNTLGIYFGGAGLSASRFADALGTALKKSFPGIKVHCGTDATNVISCASDPDRCIAAISGTGCVVYAAVNGSITRFGGVGHLFEKAGSGFEIGRDAITAALRAHDGFGEKTVLSEMVEKKLGGDVWSKIQDLYQRDIAYIASFAPLVFRAADEHDAVSMRILKRSSDHLAELIRAAMRQVGENAPVILSGSIFVREARFRRMVMEAAALRQKPEILDYPPVFGACLMCARFLHLPTLPDRDRFIKSLQKESTHAEN